MTPDQIHLLRRSFASIEPLADIAALSFYRRLFELAPQVRPLFKSDIESQSEKLMEMIAFAVNLTDKPAQLSSELRDLGARHVGYGTRDEHYAVVGTALLDMLADVLGEAFTPATRAAWTEFYGFLSDEMIKGAAMAEVDGSTAPASPAKTHAGRHE
jgi:hemoglobin-like flavoprotein